MLFNELNEDNWLLFATKNYENPTLVTYQDFEEDIKRFKYIKRLLRRYEMTGELKTHLLLNHIIVVYNVFNDAATLLLFYKIETKYWGTLKAFMSYLNRLPEKISTSDIDEECLKSLNLL
jgi:hypothetical protein